MRQSAAFLRRLLVLRRPLTLPVVRPRLMAALEKTSLPLTLDAPAEKEALGTAAEQQTGHASRGPVVTERSLLDEFSTTPGGSAADGRIVVYTDGSCVEKDASGAGINFGEKHPLTESLKLPEPHSSGLAEIAAVQRALDVLLACPRYRGEPVVVRTDYLGLVEAMNGRGEGAFAEKYKKLRETAEKFPQGVTFEHVYGHVGNVGNEKADELAREATASARRARSRSRSLSADPARRRSASRGRRRSRSRSRDPRARSASAHVPHRENAGH